VDLAPAFSGFRRLTGGVCPPELRNQGSWSLNRRKYRIDVSRRPISIAAVKEQTASIDERNSSL
jgi:hypothetical protein